MSHAYFIYQRIKTKSIKTKQYHPHKVLTLSRKFYFTVQIVLATDIALILSHQNLFQTTASSR